MDIERDFPVRYFINLGRRNDRRGETEWNLFQAGVDAKRFPAVDARFVRANRGYANRGRYALALTQRLAIRAARKHGAAAVLLFEDDVIFHQNFRYLASQISLPDDWGMFYFGCAHEEQPTVISDGLVRVKNAVDTHALAIRATYFNRVIAALDLHNKPVPTYALASDRVLAALQSEIPTYAAMPNLAWQAVAESDLVRRRYSQYGKSGVAKRNIGMTRSCLRQMFVAKSELTEPRLGLLFLTRGDVNHPSIWEQWIAQAPQRTAVYSHSKTPADITSDFLQGTHIARRFSTSWGGIGLVRASRALLQKALEDHSLTHFVLLSESCVPVRPLAEVLRRLKWNPGPQFKCVSLDLASERKRSRIYRAPDVVPGCWRFQSQWWMLDRTSAIVVTRTNHESTYEDMIVPDECYFATVLTTEGYPIDDLVFAEDITWVHWKSQAGRPTSHPELSSEHLEDIIRSQACFARKFPPDADIARFQLHLPADQSVS